jgi:hypothetical protein
MLAFLTACIIIVVGVPCALLLGAIILSVVGAILVGLLYAAAVLGGAWWF